VAFSEILGLRSTKDVHFSRFEAVFTNNFSAPVSSEFGTNKTVNAHGLSHFSGKSLQALSSYSLRSWGVDRGLLIKPTRVFGTPRFGDLEGNHSRHRTEFRGN